jgi:diaminopimelate epimerase
VAGPTPIRFEDDGRVTVDMGRPRDLREAVTVDLGDASIEGTTVSMGNPHLVLFDRPLDEVLTLGPRLEVHPDFPSKTNVEFAEVLGPRELRMRVWERGIGETQACGSGACAVAVVAAALGRTEPTVTIHLPGGDLEIARGDDGRVWMTGPAEEAFEGTIGAAWLRARGLSSERAIA